MSINKIIIVGNITRDPELKHVGSTKVCKFSIATNRKFKNSQGELQEETCFVDVQAWGRQAEIIAQYFSKGKPILVEGRLKFEQWEKDGKRNSRHIVQLETFDYMQSSKDSNEQEN